jgi:hypothetical protein
MLTYLLGSDILSLVTRDVFRGGAKSLSNNKSDNQRRILPTIAGGPPDKIHLSIPSLKKERKLPLYDYDCFYD